jgi:endonuclease-3 related protein
VLTQNTAWRNVEKAIAGFGDRLSPQYVLDAQMAELTDIIRPAGFFNQKAAYLKAVTKWFVQYEFDTSAQAPASMLNALRPELLAVKGIGKETADSILLYAFGLPTFVVDAYTVRLCERYPMDAGKGYDAVKAHFEKYLPQSAAMYNHYHALIVMNGKEHCRKRKPLCGGCPLGEVCGGSTGTTII